jgi:CheY-like chemotaxis protein
LSVQTSDGLPVIEADASQIQQIVMNLVINAAEAVPKNRSGAVIVRTFATGLAPDILSREELTKTAATTYVVLEVEDNGSGMDAETAGKVFDPFFTTKFTGRGLGLAAVQGILRRAKGHIVVDSVPGKGSTFRVFLPASHSLAPKQQEPPPEVVQHQNTAGTILVIDDEAAVRRMMSLALERAGYQVMGAGDGMKGLSLLQQHQDSVSLVLLDMGMPEMSGKEVLSRIRALQYQVPVAICSGYSEEEVLSQFGKCEFTAFIQKPFSTDQLVQRVSQVLRAVSRGA